MKHTKLITSTDVSRRMAKTKASGNKYETIVAMNLYHLGYRYRLNYRKLPGSPDIAITKHKVAVFIDGSFWHGKDWDSKKGRIQNNKSYWIEKIDENIKRDQKNDQLLSDMGWRIIHIWDVDIQKNLMGCISDILSLTNQDHC